MRWEGKWHAHGAMHFRRPAFLHCAVHTSWQRSLATPAWVCALIALALSDPTLLCQADRAMQRLLGSMLGKTSSQQLMPLQRFDGCRCARRQK